MNRYSTVTLTWTTALLSVVLLVGCGGTEVFDDNHPKVIAASQQAREDLDQFIPALQTPAGNQKSFAIRVKLEDGDRVEHLWVSEIIFEDNQFVGRLSEEPKILKTVTKGDAIQASRNQLSDWMYVEDGKLVGGYTVRIMRAMLSDAERKEFDASVPFRF